MFRDFLDTLKDFWEIQLYEHTTRLKIVLSSSIISALFSASYFLTGTEVPTMPPTKAGTQLASLAPTPAEPKLPQSKAKKCCWCYQKYEDENRLWGYTGPTSCESLSGVGGYANCKEIQVKGDACTFTAISSENGHVMCGMKKVEYLDADGEYKSIDPPKRNLGGASATCAKIQASSYLADSQRPQSEKDKAKHENVDDPLRGIMGPKSVGSLVH